MKLTAYTLPLLLVISILISCNSKTKKKEILNNSPNVILLIGDGMGLSELSSAYYYGEKISNFSRFHEIGLINTSSASHKITDSAAGVTAFSCGEKTYNGALGMNSDTIVIPNIVEILSAQKYNTAVVATSSVTHATPAGFYAHVKSRSMQNKIAEQLAESEIDFFAGGGTKYFSNREDSLDILQNLADNGFEINSEMNSTNFNIDNKYGFILAEGGMPTMLENRGDFLPKYTQLALDYLSQKDESFFLMVEGSQIDWAGHGNNADYLIAEVLDFDKTVGIAMDFADNNKNTLVIVLADHETGGFTLAAKDSNYNIIEPKFATGGHSTTLIPVFAFGPGAENFKGIYQNNEIFHKILSLIK